MSIDTEIRLLIDAAHTEAWKVINDNRHVLDRLATELLEKETLDHDQLAIIFADVRKLPQRPQWLSSDARPVSDMPPVAVPQRPVAKAVAAKKPATRKPAAAKPAAVATPTVRKPTVRKPVVKKPAAEKPAAPSA